MLTLGITAGLPPTVWTLTTGDTITLMTFVDPSGSAIVGSLPNFGVQITQPFLTTTTHLCGQALGGPGSSGAIANVQFPTTSREDA